MNSLATHPPTLACGRNNFQNLDIMDGRGMDKQKYLFAVCELATVASNVTAVFWYLKHPLLPHSSVAALFCLLRCWRFHSVRLSLYEIKMKRQVKNKLKKNNNNNTRVTANAVE